MMVPGDELRRRREANGWSQEDAARLIGYTEHIGTGVKQINRWESGKTKNPRSPNYHEYVRLLTGIEQVGLTEISEQLTAGEERLRRVEGFLAELLVMIREQQETLRDGRWTIELPPGQVVRLDPEQFTELVERVTGTGPSERFLKRAQEGR